MASAKVFAGTTSASSMLPTYAQCRHALESASVAGGCLDWS